MTDFIIKTFIKDYENVKNPVVRENYGKLASIVGIIANSFLSLSKILIGLIFNSISITADGVNNLSDTSSSIITFIGFKMGGKPADKDHPFGHARLEYLSGLVVGIAIILLGIELIKTSAEKVLNPEPLKYSILMIMVLLLSIVVKLWMCYFNLKLSKKISSSTLKATSMDSRNDVITTSAILISILISKATNMQIDGYMGCVVALFILCSGVNILRDIMNPLLGELPDEEFVNEIEAKIMSYEGVLNIHDLVIHNYGPSRYFATVHVEVDAKEDIMKSHDMIDNIERDFARDLNINLVIHLDPVITDDGEINNLRMLTNNIVKSINDNLSIHDFRVVRGETHTNLIFDVVVPFDFNINSNELAYEIERLIKEEDETYFTVITVDKNYVSTCMSEFHLK